MEQKKMTEMKLTDVLENIEVDEVPLLIRESRDHLKWIVDRAIEKNAFFAAELGEQGRLTVPRAERKKLDLEKGTLVQVFIRKIDTEETPKLTLKEIKRETLSEILFHGDTEKNWSQVYNALDEDVRVMLIGESPNTISTYFYNLDGKSSFRKKLLDPIVDEDYVDEREALRDLIKDKGVYVEDLFNEPIKEVPFEREAVEEHKEELRKEIKKIDPDLVVFMLPKGGFGQKDQKSKRMAYYFEEARNSEPAEFIETQKKILENLRNEMEINFETAVAPFPKIYGTIAKEWKEEDIHSFSDWVHKNKEWLENNGE